MGKIIYIHHNFLLISWVLERTLLPLQMRGEPEAVQLEIIHGSHQEEQIRQQTLRDLHGVTIGEMAAKDWALKMKVVISDISNNLYNSSSRITSFLFGISPRLK
jgi:hypothetical protein